MKSETNYRDDISSYFAVESDYKFSFKHVDVLPELKYSGFICTVKKRAFILKH